MKVSSKRTGTARLDKFTKAHYRIRPTAEGNWAGQCWACDLLFHATDRTVSQIGVVNAIREHENEVHYNR